MKQRFCTSVYAEQNVRMCPVGALWDLPFPPLGVGDGVVLDVFWFCSCAAVCVCVWLCGQQSRLCERVLLHASYSHLPGPLAAVLILAGWNVGQREGSPQTSPFPHPCSTPSPLQTPPHLSPAFSSLNPALSPRLLSSSSDELCPSHARSSFCCLCQDLTRQCQQSNQCKGWKKWYTNCWYTLFICKWFVCAFLPCLVSKKRLCLCWLALLLTLHIPLSIHTSDVRVHVRSVAVTDITDVSKYPPLFWGFACILHHECRPKRRLYFTFFLSKEQSACRGYN